MLNATIVTNKITAGVFISIGTLVPLSVVTADKGYDSEDNHVLVRDVLHACGVIPARYEHVPIRHLVKVRIIYSLPSLPLFFECNFPLFIVKIFYQYPHSLEYSHTDFEIRSRCKDLLTT
jgi:hypothetical protein